MDAENTHQVFDWLWSSGQLSEADIDRLPSLGVTAVVNLAPPTASNALPGEAERVSRLGIAYMQIPVAWDNPQLDQLWLFFSLLEARAGHKLWVHCARNMRVSAFLYLYRRLQLAEAEEAAAWPMREVWTPNEIWQDFIEQARLAYGRRGR